MKGSPVAFATNCVNALVTDTPNGGFRFDGIDIDWETPASTADTKAFNQVLAAFRSALNAYQTKNQIAEHLLLTAAFSPEYTSNGWQYIDFAGAQYPPGATSSVDFFNVEFYEYECACDGVTEADAPLYEINADLYSSTSIFGASKGIIATAKVPPGKIVLGIPFYGIHYTGVSSGSTLGQPGTLELDSQGDVVTYPYYAELGEPGTQYNDGDGSTNCNTANEPVTCDGIGGADWIWNPSSEDLWAFDNPETITQKARYAQDHELGGIMSWNLQFDTTKGALLDAMSAGLAMNQIIVGAANDAWGINRAGVLYEFSSGAWKAVPGNLTQLSVGPTGDVWGLNASGQIWHWVVGSPSHWQRVNGTAKQIAVGTDYLWVLTMAGQIFYTADKPASGSGASQIKWISINGRLASITLDPTSDTDLWGINSAGKLYELVNSAWVARGNYSAVAVASSTEAAALDSLGNVYIWNGATWKNTGKELAQVAITSSGTTWGISSTGQIWQLPSGSSTWTSVAGSLREIALGTNLWGLNSRGNVYQYVGSSFELMPGVL